jgi:uncharacterized alpha-E superfamily protein
MGIISLEKQDQLFWLGRYCERVYTTIRMFLLGYDKLLDDEQMSYKSICTLLDIPDIYHNETEFINTFIYSAEDPNSVYRNLQRAYDNAIVLRDEISSISLSYIEMALAVLEQSSKQPFSLLQLQDVLDLLLAFWGSVDVYVLSDNSRDIIKCGRSLERMDLYIRLGYPTDRLNREFHMFATRLKRIRENEYNKDAYYRFVHALQDGKMIKEQLLNLNAIFVRRVS